MTPFGPNEEQTLLKAIKSAVDLVSAGSSPDDAIAKVAGDQQLHPDTLPMFVHAYNVGQQTHRREKCAGEGTSCLVEPYPIARIENVQDKLYPSPTKKAAVEVVDECYSMSPVPVRAYEEEKLAALQAIKLPTQMPPRRPAWEFLVDDVNHLKSAAEKSAARMDNALRESHEEMLGKLDAVCGYFKQSSDRRLSVAEVEYNSRLTFGSEVEALFDIVAGVSKEARATGVVRTTQPVVLTQAPYSLVKAALDKVHEYVGEERIVADTKRKIASEVAKADPFAVASEPNPLLVDLPPFQSSQLKEAGFLSSLAGGAGGVAAAMKSIPVANTSDLVDDATEKLNDPGHMADMRRVQVRAMLSDLMANDDVISGYDPSEVTDAYNDIAQFSPNLATQSAAVRGLLRRRLTGGVLETHDAQQLADIEKSLRRDTPGAPKPPK